MRIPMNKSPSPSEHRPNDPICYLLGEALKYAAGVMGSTVRAAAARYDELPKAVRAAGEPYDATCMDQVAEWWRSLPSNITRGHTPFAEAIDRALVARAEFEMELFAREVLGCTCPVELAV
jgi:hypothetical protein